jgi:DNA modification methylase
MARRFETHIAAPIRKGLSPYDMKIELRALSDLEANSRNARTHDNAQISKLADAIRTFGFTVPILIDEVDRIIAGHGRAAAARVLGLVDVPTIRLNYLSPAEKRAYAIADNRLAELAGWDREILALEFQELGILDFDLSLTGFEVRDIDLILDEQGTGMRPEAPIAAPNYAKCVARPGDLWLLGEHRLYCGSALESVSYAALMGDERAAMAFTDSPYNVPVQGHVSGLGQAQHREFAMASGEMSAAEFTTFLRTAFEHMAAWSAEGSLHFLCMDWRHMSELLTAASGPYSELKNLCVWNKDNGGMGSLYRSKHELVFVYKKGRGPHVNNVELGRNGRNRTNVWDYAGQNTFHANRAGDLADHPTIKPTALVADAIRDVTRRGDLVLDPFVGSGTTILAAEVTGRCARAIELEPAYVDVAIRRWEELSGRPATLEATGSTFAQTRSDREQQEVNNVA